MFMVELLCENGQPTRQVLEGAFSIFFKKKLICASTMPKDSPEFITWLESLPQRKPEGHPDRVEWELSLSSIPFDERMKDLKEYKEKFGDCNVSKYQEGYESLSFWVHNMRQAKKHLDTRNIWDT